MAKILSRSSFLDCFGDSFSLTSLMTLAKPPSRATSVFSSPAACFAQSLRGSEQRRAEKHDVLEQKAVDGTRGREGARRRKKKRKCNYEYPARCQTPVS